MFLCLKHTNGFPLNLKLKEISWYGCKASHDTLSPAYCSWLFSCHSEILSSLCPSGLPVFCKHTMLISASCNLYVLFSGLGMLFTATSHPSLWHQFLLREIISRSPNLVFVTSLTLKLPYSVILFDFLHGSWYYLNISVVLLVYYLMRVQTLTCLLLYP